MTSFFEELFPEYKPIRLRFSDKALADSEEYLIECLIEHLIEYSGTSQQTFAHSFGCPYIVRWCLSHCCPDCDFLSLSVLLLLVLSI
jgi:hypothetical protein